MPQSQGRFVAFLRAINVGGHSVKMDRLRALIEELGLSDVATFIASGNVIFSADDEGAGLETRIERQLYEALGYEVAAFVRTLAGLADIVGHDAFPSGESGQPGTMYVGFLKSEADAAARRAVTDLESDTNSFAFHGSELYWLCRTRFSDSPVSGGLLERTLGMQLTIRNANTLHRIVDKYAAS